MDANNLIRMVNQIGAFFEPMPDRAEAIDGIAAHLRKFWEPRMRRQLFALIDAGQTEGFSPLVLEAIQARAVELRP